MENEYERGKKKIREKYILQEALELIYEAGELTEGEKNCIKGRIERGEA